MSTIDCLIAEMCPSGVVFKPLASLGRRNKGTAITAAKMKVLAHSPGPIRVFAGGQTIADVAENAIPDKDIVREPSIIVKSRGHIGFSFYEMPFTHKSELWSYTIDSRSVVQKFVYYYLLTQLPRLQTIARATSVKLPQLSVKDTDGLRIPVPPLPVQHETVRILDMFTQLEAELEAELEARKKQYSYYAGRLLEPKDGDRRFALGQIAKIVRGASPRPIRSFVTDDGTGTPWIKIGDVPVEGKYVTQTKQRINDAGVKKSRLIKPGDFILSNSMSFGRPYISQIEGCIHDGWLSISQFDETLIPDYLYYLLRSGPVQTQFSQRAGSSTVKNLNADIVRGVVVSVPSLEVQRRTVEILNNFDYVTNDLYSGLPAEILARRNQYEHYRDKLLTFEELPA